MIAQPHTIRRLTVEQYHRMGEVGILTEDDAVELLEGLLVEEERKTPRHSYSTNCLREVLERTFEINEVVWKYDPITMSDSEPEPDVSVTRGHLHDYRERHPHPADVLLVVEVADSLLQQDRTLKLRIYAGARIPAYWILNLPERTLEVYTEPAGEGMNAQYRQRRTYVETDTAPVWIDGQEVGQVVVGDLLA